LFYIKGREERNECPSVRDFLFLIFQMFLIYGDVGGFALNMFLLDALRWVEACKMGMVHRISKLDIPTKDSEWKDELEYERRRRFFSFLPFY
jgi:hypothetical protein